MRILMVGAGTVGQTYGSAVARGGAELFFYARPKYREAVAAGTRVIRARGRGETLVPAGVLSELDELDGERFDQVWLTMSSTALDQPWREPFLARTGDATVVVLQNGLGDRERVSRQIGEARTVSGLINLAAWDSPLEGEGPEGVVWVTAPFAAQPFSGERAAEVAAALRAGGMRARVVEDAVAQGSFGGAALQSMIGALELAGWSFARWPEQLPLGAASAQQALDIAAAQLGRPAPAALRQAMRPWLLRAALPAIRAAFPADLETYLRVHFTKVGDQTVSSLGRLVDEGKARGLPTDHMQALLDAIAAHRE